MSVLWVRIEGDLCAMLLLQGYSDSRPLLPVSAAGRRVVASGNCSAQLGATVAARKCQ